MSTTIDDAGTAEDLVQEAFIRAYRAFDRTDDDSRVRPWLHQILANVCVDDANRRRDDDKTERFSCARVSHARNAMRLAIQGAAAFPIACSVLLRRPGKGALAASPPPDPLAAMKASESVGAQSRIAFALQPSTPPTPCSSTHPPRSRC
jgi:RNA polymerase sigma factor (sigma-70 family)